MHGKHHHHDHDDHHHNGSAHAESAGAGHNHQRPPGKVAQWQTPHRGEPLHADHDRSEPDVDLVEAAFIEGFTAATDPTSFLRLAHVPFEIDFADGRKFSLLRVETEFIADVGAVMPHLGGKTFRYDPLPASHVARRRRLRFVYFDGDALHPLTLEQIGERLVR